VSAIDELVSANRAAVESGEAATAGLSGAPGRAVAIVTCMDCRIDVERSLGLARGDAHVLRNAGGVVTDDVIRSLALSQRKLGTREVMLIHHDKCGLATVTDDGFRAELQEATGVAPAFAIESFTDVAADVRQSIERVRRSPFLPHTDSVRGFVFDVDSGALREVVDANPPGEEVV
jgi:carbonic anhydrase